MKKKLFTGLVTGLLMFGMVGVASASVDKYEITLSNFSITPYGGATISGSGFWTKVELADSAGTYLQDSNYGLLPQNVSVANSQGGSSYVNGNMTSYVTPTTYNLNTLSKASADGDITVTGKGFVIISADYSYSIPVSIDKSKGSVSAALSVAKPGRSSYDYIYASWDNTTAVPTSDSGSLYVRMNTVDGDNPLKIGAYTTAQGTSTHTPIPGAALLFGSSLLGLLGIGNRKNKA